MSQNRLTKVFVSSPVSMIPVVSKQRRPSGTGRRSAEICVILVTLVALCYQVWLTVDEWIFQCATNVAIATHGGWTRLPAMTLCIPLRDMIDHRLNTTINGLDSGSIHLVSSVHDCLTRMDSDASRGEKIEAGEVIKYCVHTAMRASGMTYFHFMDQLIPNRGSNTWYMPASLGRVMLEFPNDTTLWVESNFVTYSDDVCWTYFTDTNTTFVVSQNGSLINFSGYLDNFLTIKVHIVDFHHNLTQALHSPMLRHDGKTSE